MPYKLANVIWDDNGKMMTAGEAAFSSIESHSSIGFDFPENAMIIKRELADGKFSNKLLNLIFNKNVNFKWLRLVIKFDDKYALETYNSYCRQADELTLNEFLALKCFVLMMLEGEQK